MRTERHPVALTIAGSDPCGGAGLQMDLKVFCDLGVYGAAVPTAITVQNSQGVRRVQGLSARLVEEQIEAVLDDLPVAAIKTGMLWSAAIVRAIARQFRDLNKAVAQSISSPLVGEDKGGGKHPHPPSRASKPSFGGRSSPNPPPSRGRERCCLVIDPVIWAGGGTRLLSESGLKALVKELFPLAALVTPNLAEAAAISGLPVKNTKEARLAAEKILGLGASAVLVKGGHLRGTPVDLLFDGYDFTELSGVRCQGPGVRESLGLYVSRSLSLDSETQRLIDSKTPQLTTVNRQLSTVNSIHGTGCALSAAITAFLARGLPLKEAITQAHAYIQQLIHHAAALGKGSRLLLPGYRM